MFVDKDVPRHGGSVEPSLRNGMRDLRPHLHADREPIGTLKYDTPSYAMLFVAVVA
jgi:hypothetical protein